MRLARCVQKALDEYDAGDYECAMLHACNAVDAAAAEATSRTESNRTRFVGFVRAHSELLQYMGVNGLDVAGSTFEVDSALVRTDGPHADLAELIYVAHRCSHAHGDDVPAAYALHDEAQGIRIGLEADHVMRLPTGVIYGLLAIAVMAPDSAGESIGDPRYRLSWTSPQPSNQRIERPVDDWWGCEDELLALARSFPQSYVTAVAGADHWPVHVDEGGPAVEIRTEF